MSIPPKFLSLIDHTKYLIYPCNDIDQSKKLCINKLIIQWLLICNWIGFVYSFLKQYSTYTIYTTATHSEYHSFVLIVGIGMHTNEPINHIKVAVWIDCNFNLNWSDDRPTTHTHTHVLWTVLFLSISISISYDVMCYNVFIYHRIIASSQQINFVSSGRKVVSPKKLIYFTFLFVRASSNLFRRS